MAAKPPEHEHHPSSFPPATSFSSSSILIHQSSTIDFSPPLIAMVVVAAAAFLFITYSRLISRHIFPPFLRLYHHHRRCRFLPSSDLGSPPGPYQSSDGFYVYSPYPYPYGLDDSVIKNIPLTKLKFIELDEDEFHFHDCAVCLVDFQEGECIRTLPHCCHPFHVDCIDMWLRSHATCPLCRAGVFLSPPSDSSHPHVQLSPVMAARVRPSFDQGILLESMFLEPLQEVVNNYGEIQEMEIFSPESERRAIQSEDHQSSSNNRRELDFLLKRSYSFGFERRSSYPSESDQRVVMESATTPYHHHRQRRSFFWRKQRPSSSLTPFRSMAKSRVFSLRRTMKSQSPACFRRKGYISIWECSESESLEIEYGSSRRMKASPGPFSSSRMRLGDPEALISPERYNRHRR